MRKLAIPELPDAIETSLLSVTPGNTRESKHASLVRNGLGACRFHFGHGSQYANFGAVQERVQGRIRKDVDQRPVYEGLRRLEGQKVTGISRVLPGPSQRRPCFLRGPIDHLIIEGLIGNVPGAVSM